MKIHFNSMTDKFRNKYRIASARLKNWDYGRNASYFITICTKNRAHFFGEVNPITHEMQLTEIGKLADKFWMEIPIHFPFVQLGEFVVMPNHTHGILIIKKIEWNGIGNCLLYTSDAADERSSVDFGGRRKIKKKQEKKKQTKTKRITQQ